MLITKDAARAPEHKDLPLNQCKLEIRASKSGKGFRFKGYGSVWGRTDSYGDTILRGAFSEAIKGRTPIMLFGHKMDRVPGKWIEAGEDEIGLLLEGELTPGHSEARDLEASLRHESITGLSIGGYTKSADWIEEDGQLIGRRIKEFDLYEVSVVSMPAEDAARIAASSIKQTMQDCKSIREVEAYLREGMGFTRAGAEALIGRVKDLACGDRGAGSGTEDGSVAAIKALKFPTSILQG